MIKYTLLSLLLLLTTAAISQPTIGEETPIQTVTRIFSAYMQQQTENQDIPENKESMMRALYALQDTADKKDFGILVNAWLNYEPPNFPTKKLIEPILYKDKVAAIEAINERMIYINNWAGKNTTPGSDLVKLRDKIYNH